MSSLERLRAYASDRGWWAALAELADDPSLRSELERELGLGPEAAGLSRREFLAYSAGALLLAGASACRQPLETIVPYLDRPEPLTQGQTLWFSSVLPHGGYGRGVLVKSFLGRPIKVDGNPEHPDSLGALDARTQAELLELYDPGRSQAAVREGGPATRAEFLAALQTALSEHGGARGSRVRVLTGTVASPTLAAQLSALRRKLPEARWHTHEPAGRGSVREGARLAFGRRLEPQLRLEEAEVLVCLDADLFFAEPAALRLARRFAERRDPAHGSRMLRVYAAEPAPGLTGSIADHRLPVPAGRVEALARRLAALTGAGPEAAALDDRSERWLKAAAADLKAARGRGLVAAGAWQPPEVHWAAHAVNAALGNTGRTVRFTEPPEAEPEGDGSLAALASEIEAGRVGVLLILHSNPAYDSPAGLGFGELLPLVPFTVHLGTRVNETAGRCRWHLAAAHGLEAWGDLRASDGTASIRQPLIEPLYNGMSEHDLLGALAGDPETPAYERVRRYWQARGAGGTFERDWRRWLHDGVIPSTAFGVLTPQARPLPRASAASEPAGLEAAFRPDHRVWDGRYASNAWLQELPDPVTKLTWDNAAWVSSADADRLKLSSGDRIRLSLGAASIEAAAWIVPGQAQGSVTLPLGSGRALAGAVGTGSGFSAYALRPKDGTWHSPGLSIERLRGREELASTQEHHRMESRAPARAATLAQLEHAPHFAQAKPHTPRAEDTLYGDAPPASKDYAWGMVVDLNRCIGCNACVLACQAENNVPSVGKAEVLRGREMHWLRVDRYEEGPPDDPVVLQQPLACVHCENAPCETVCPVEATKHSEDGLNEMVYNRCVGTRYCSNNCPYKVRRFNFFQYADLSTESLKLGRNPEVTVRNRGVMEKCTYCVQRIQAARITAEREGRLVKDGEVVTACQAACPTSTIVFGNLRDPESRAAKAQKDPRGYGLLAELGTRPRTTYLARITNPNPRLEEGA